jgi:hypothetical protein
MDQLANMLEHGAGKFWRLSDICVTLILRHDSSAEKVHEYIKKG